MSRVSPFAELQQFVAQLQTKQAGVKRAEPLSEPGGHDGASSHPSAKADDGLQSATEGARSTENAADVQASPAPATMVDAIPPAKPGDEDQAKAQLQTGTKQTPTGEDPQTERDFKGTKDDPGTTHPANAETTGEKYSADLSALPFDKLAELCASLGNEILAEVAVRGTQQKTAAETPAAQPQAQQPADVHAAAEAGYKLAEALGAGGSDEAAVAFIDQTIKEAHYQADLVAAYLVKPAEDAEKQSEPPTEGGEAAPPAAGGDAELPGLAGVMSQMGAAGAPAEEPAGEVGQDEAVEALAQALAEAGISPDELIALLQSELGGAGGGDAAMPPAEGGAPPELAGAGMGGETKLSAAKRTQAANVLGAVKLAKAHRLSGSFKPQAAKTARERTLRDKMQEYVNEALRSVRG